MTPMEVAEWGEVLRVEVGSRLHGISVGSDDQDMMGVCVEPSEYVIGLRHFEQWTYRTQPEGARSGPGDVDLVVYSLRKWASLALKGNPSVLCLMFAPPDAILEQRSHYADQIRSLAPLIASRRAGSSFLGYMVSQKERLLGERGQMRVKRPELVEAHGYDTKYAGHVLRLAHQGIEYMQTGRLTLPMPDREGSEVVDVREGRVDFNQAMTRIGELEHDLRDSVDSSPLDPDPDYDAVNDALVGMHLEFWRNNRADGLPPPLL